MYKCRSIVYIQGNGDRVYVSVIGLVAGGKHARNK